MKYLSVPKKKPYFVFLLSIFYQVWIFKFWNILTCGIVTTILKLTETDNMLGVMCQRSHVMCRMSHVTCNMCSVMSHASCVKTCHVSRVLCHLSQTPTATATDPPTANSPIMHSRLVLKDPKTQKNAKLKKNLNNKNQNLCRGNPILAIHSITRSLQFTGKLGLRDGTHTHNLWTLHHRDWIKPVGRFSETLYSRVVIKPSWLWALLLSPRLLFPILPLCPKSSFCLDSKQDDWISRLSNIVPFYSFHSSFLGLLQSCSIIKSYNL